MDPVEYVSYFLMGEPACKKLCLFSDKEIAEYVRIHEFVFITFPKEFI
jgi:hypothetical protein